MSTRLINVSTTRRNQRHREITRVGLRKLDACRATRPVASVDEDLRPVHENVSRRGVFQVRTHALQRRMTQPVCSAQGTTTIRRELSAYSAPGGGGRERDEEVRHASTVGIRFLADRAPAP